MSSLLMLGCTTHMQVLKYAYLMHMYEKKILKQNKEQNHTSIFYLTFLSKILNYV